MKNRKEAQLIRRGLEQADVRALVFVMGALAPLSERQQARAMRYVSDMLDEERERLGEQR